MFPRRPTRFFAAGAAATAGLFLALPAFAQFDYAAPSVVPTGLGPDGVASGDFDGDGDVDLAVATDNPDKIEIYLNSGALSFGFGFSIAMPNSSSPGELVAADFDGDGDVDIAVILRDLNVVRLVLNNGGSFSLGSSAAIGSNARGMSSGDMDGDGDTDLVVANRDSNTATALRNNGDGTFTSLSLAAGLEPRAATFVDINGDGLLDVAVSNNDSRSISLFTQSGGAFNPSGTLSTGAQLRPEGITSADVNADGQDDLLVATEGNGQNFASVYLNQGGAFAGMINYGTGGVDTSGILAADLDCDGDIDIATLNDTSQNISLLPNGGAGTFGAPMLLGLQSEPSNFIASDLDSDGDAELVATNRDANSMSIFENNCATAGGVATLDRLNVRVGTVLSGDLDSMRQSDDVPLRVRSGPGLQAQEAFLVHFDLEATSPVSAPSVINFAIESRVFPGVVTAKISLRNWTTGAWDQLAVYAVDGTDSVFQSPDFDASLYVRAADNRIEMRVKNSVVVALQVIGFDSFFDHLEINVR